MPEAVDRSAPAHDRFASLILRPTMKIPHQVRDFHGVFSLVHKEKGEFSETPPKYAYRRRSCKS
jgi:hypothetical protein